MTKSSTNSLSDALKKNEAEFRNLVSDELSSLIASGKPRHLAVLILLKRIAINLELPSKTEIDETTKNFRGLTKEQAVRALIIRAELRKLKAKGLNSLKAIHELKDRLIKNKEERYDEYELMKLWEKVGDQESVSKLLLFSQKEQEMYEKLGTIGLEYINRKRPFTDLEDSSSSRQLRPKAAKKTKRGAKTKHNTNTNSNNSGITGYDSDNGQDPVVNSNSVIKKRTS